jgi:hypothetical protein
MRVLVLVVVTATTFFSCAAHAQFVKGNEAVRSGPMGKRVETPPIPSSVIRPCGPNSGCHAGAWRVVETDAGLMECTETWARPESCRSSTYGTQKLPRLWVVKRDGQWFHCQYPDLSSKCTPVFARPPANLPFDAIQ